MASRTTYRQQSVMSLAENVKAVPNKKPTRNGRSALGNIQNKLGTVQAGVQGKNSLLPVKGCVTRSDTSLQKDNIKIQKENIVADQLKPVEKHNTEDLNKSLMDISISEEQQQSAFSSCLLPFGVNAIDAKDDNNQFLCSEYVMEIYHYLHQMEMKWCIRHNFLSKQRDITPRMRAILIDWLNQVHSRFCLLQETLYLTVAIIDRFLQDYEVSRAQLQLVGITAMFIASKYEEMYSPEVNDFVYITDNAYSKRDIFKMECLILQTIQFSLSRPLPLHFLRRNSKAGDCDAVVHTVAKYLMELSLQDYELASVPPSQLAAAALLLSLRIMDDASWTPDLSFYSGYSEEQSKHVVVQLARLLLRNGNSKLQAVQKKYTSSKLMKVSTFPQLRSQVMEKIANSVP